MFSKTSELFRSVYEIDWDEELGRLRFFELQRFRGANNRTVSSSHAGGIYISPAHRHGAHAHDVSRARCASSRWPSFGIGDTRLRGVILTQSDREHFFQPATSAIFLRKLSGRRRLSELERMVGPIASTHADFAAALAEIEEIERSAIFLAGPIDD